MSVLDRIKNIVLPPKNTNPVYTPTDRTNKRDLKNVPFPSQVSRTKQDIANWRRAVTEAEMALTPFTAKMQNMYIDTVLNGHVYSCMEKRVDMTLSKDIAIKTQKGTIDIEATKLIDMFWMRTLIKHILDAKAFGYTLMQLRDVIGNDIKSIDILPRMNVSPSKKLLLTFEYALSGVDFTNKKEYPNAIWVKTDPDMGVEQGSGYGYLYRVAPYEILLRNNLGYNADFVEKFVMPYIHAKTDKGEGAERDLLEQAIVQMASNAYAITDTQDEISFLDNKNLGSGYQSYDNFENRCEAKISKIILGHSHAIDAQTGKLGSSDEVKDALKLKQNSDIRFVEYVINDNVLPVLRELGFNIPLTSYFCFLHNEEEEEGKTKKVDYIKKVADMVKVFSDAGVKVPIEYIEQMTGIKVSEKTAEPIEPISTNIQNKLKELYK